MTSAMRFSALAAEARSANDKRAMSALIMSWDPQQLTQAPGGQSTRVSEVCNPFPGAKSIGLRRGVCHHWASAKIRSGGVARVPGWLAGLPLRAHLSAGGRQSQPPPERPAPRERDRRALFVPQGLARWRDRCWLRPGKSLAALAARLCGRWMFAPLVIWPARKSRGEHLEENEEEQSGRPREEDKERRQSC